MLEINKMLTLSTSHISKETAWLLDNEVFNFAVFSKASYGWFIALPESIEKNEIPDDLFACLLLAYSHGCIWLCLDCDAEPTDILQTYNW